VATQELAAGLGLASMGSPEQMALAKGIWQQGDATVQAAIRAGEQDLITAGAVDGSSASIELALKKGRESWEFSWMPYILAGGALAVGGGVALVLSQS
jgi:tetrahydromethanopterin S-methyltransferase subunit D